MAILRSSKEHHAVMWDEEWPLNEMALWRVNKQKMLFAWKQKLKYRNVEWIYFQQTIMNKHLTVIATYETLSKDWRKEVASFEGCISLWLEQVLLQAIYFMVNVI